MCEWRGKFAREALDVVNAHFESSEELKDEDGNISTDDVVDYVKYMAEYTAYGYRFIYLDVDNLVSLVTAF